MARLSADRRDAVAGTTLSAVRIHVVRDRGAATFNRFGQHRDNRFVQAAQALPAQTARDRLGMNSRAEQGFIRVDVADTAQEVLVEEQGLDGRFAPARAAKELLKGYLQRLGPSFSTRSGMASVSWMRPNWR